MVKTFLKKFCIIFSCVVCAALYMPRLSADEDVSMEANSMDMVVGDIQTVKADHVTRVSVANPEVADISNAENDKVSLMAKKEGQTLLFLWDAGGKRTIKVRVAGEDLTALKARLQKILQEANISGIALEENYDIGKVVLSGDLSKEDKTRVSDVLQPYSTNLLNLIKEEKNEELIQVDMQIVEISVTLEKNLGILWGTSTSATTGTTTASSTNNGQVALNYGENLPGGDKFKDLFKIGNFSRTTPLETTVNALVQEGKARLISKPRLVVVSGKQASFLVGGEIPIQSQTTNASSTSTTTTTTYSQYGVNLSVTPTVKDGKIDILLNVDIRDVDASTPITSGNVAFVTRTASTDLLMDNKQTIALAGLIKYEDSVNLTEVPFLSKIPVLGALFRDRSQPSDTNTEMVIILTPTVLTEKKFVEKQLVMPTSEERSSWKMIDAKYEHEPINSNWPPSQASAPSAPTDAASVVAATSAYARMVQQKISAAIAYPASALGRDMAGTVKLKLRILRNGSLDSAEIIESSGNNILDQDAVLAAKTAAPYDAFSGSMNQDDLIFTIPIVYNKFISAGQAPAEKVIASY